jgi:PhzF family phenazine biosynthesis protein
MGIPLYQVDAFADRPFCGNPAAVCLLDGPREDGWMQLVAREMNLSETAFLLPDGDLYRLRWFTPAAEVDLCGHATLASAHVLWETRRLSPDATAKFETRSGLLTATRGDSWIEMDFPAKVSSPCEAPPELERALGVSLLHTERSQFDYLVEVASEEEVRALRPDFGLLMQSPARGVIVTSRSSDPNYDFVSRFFAPCVGVNEDPVTGSAHCSLGPYWRRRLGKSDFLAFQASARQGVIRVGVRDDRVLLGGQAITVMRADFLA